MNVPLLDLKRQYKKIKEEIKPQIEEICATQSFINGPKVEELERNFALFCGTKHAVGCSSGTDALILSLLALDVGSGDEVITTPFTFFATIEAIIRVGATPVLIDIEEESYNLNVDQLEKAITEKTKAIIPVHIFGQCCDMTKIMSIANKHNLHVIEDAAQAVGAEHKNKRAGSFGTTGCFSFFPSKNLGGFGDGGIVTTNDENLYKKMLMLRQHGIDPENRYFYKYLGGNFRLDAIQAAVVNIKLKYIIEWQEARRKNAIYYDKALNSVVKPIQQKNNYHVYNQYVIRHPRRDEIKKHLTNLGIGCAIYYPYPLHLQPCVSFLGYKEGDFPVCETACREVLALPIYPEVTRREQDTVISAIGEIL